MLGNKAWLKAQAHPKGTGGQACASQFGCLYARLGKILCGLNFVHRECRMLKNDTNSFSSCIFCYYDNQPEPAGNSLQKINSIMQMRKVYFIHFQRQRKSGLAKDDGGKKMKEYFDACLFDDRSIAFFQLSNNDTEQVQHRCLIPNYMCHLDIKLLSHVTLYFSQWYLNGCRGKSAFEQCSAFPKWE